MGCKAVIGTMYAVPTHSTCSNELKVEAITGNAVATIRAGKAKKKKEGCYYSSNIKTCLFSCK